MAFKVFTFSAYGDETPSKTRELEKELNDFLDSYDVITVKYNSTQNGGKGSWGENTIITNISYIVEYAKNTGRL